VILLLKRKIQSFTRLSTLSVLLLVPAYGLTGLARSMVLLVPFKRIAPYLGLHLGVQAVIPLLNTKQLRRAISIGRAVRIAAQYTPWNANCQAQAITARVLLGLFCVPYSLLYGVAKDTAQDMKAHVWVCAGPVCVTGGYAFNEFTVVSVFVSQTLKTAPTPL
jgi:hypothetical protein